MKRDIRFVKLAKRWFALFPLFDEGDVDDLEMVGGADLFLNTIYDTRHKVDGIVSLEVSDEEMPCDFILGLKNDDVLDGEVGKNYEVVKSRMETVKDIWMCPVLRWFFCGEYPEKIYVRIKE